MEKVLPPSRRVGESVSDEGHNPRLCSTQRVNSAHNNGGARSYR